MMIEKERNFKMIKQKDTREISPKQNSTFTIKEMREEESTKHNKVEKKKRKTTKVLAHKFSERERRRENTQIVDKQRFLAHRFRD